MILKIEFLVRYGDGFKSSVFSNYLSRFPKWSNYWCANVNDTYVMLCYRNQINGAYTRKSECLISEDGIKFTEPDDVNHIVYELNHDYETYAKMTTFMGQPVLVGQTPDSAGNVQKYVEVFHAGSKRWELKTTEIQ